MKSAWLEKLRRISGARRPFQNIRRNRLQGGSYLRVLASACKGVRVNPLKLPCLKTGVDAAGGAVGEVHLRNLPYTSDQKSHIVFRDHRFLVRVNLLRAFRIDVDS